MYGLPLALGFGSGLGLQHISGKRYRRKSPKETSHLKGESQKRELPLPPTLARRDVRPGNSVVLLPIWGKRHPKKEGSAVRITRKWSSGY